MKILKITLLIVVLFPLMSKGQGVRFTEKYGPFHDTYTQENDLHNRKAIPYSYVSEADVMWSKVTWEIVDLREKMNLPLYYPIDTIHNRKSLINALVDGVAQNRYTAFKPPLKMNAFEFDPVNVYNGVEDLKNKGSREQIIRVQTRPGLPAKDSLVVTRWKPEEIKQILVKSVWYFNKKDSKLHNEIIGLCPIREYVFNGVARRDLMFWFYYPDLRDYLATVPVFNPINDKELYTFDDIFVNRYFNSYFIQESNVYDDRQITDYLEGDAAQRESEKIRSEIFNFEQDLWEY